MIYRAQSGAESGFAVLAVAGEVSLADRAALVELPSLEPETPLILPGAELRREDYGHLQLRRTVAGIAYIPLRTPGDDDLAEFAVVLELISFGPEIDDALMESLDPVLALAGPALESAERTDRDQHNSLHSIHRMSQLYDLEKSLNATLELTEVTALAPQKVRPMLACQTVHLWLFDGDVLRLLSSAGADASVEAQMTMRPGEGYVADMAEEGEVLCIVDAADERLAQRNARLGDEPATPPIFSTLIVPLLQDGAEVGVLEVVNREDGKPFDDDDQFFLVSIAETVSSALKNASLMHSERKLQILEALVTVSSEITSTLRLDRVLQIIVNSPQSVLPYDVCAIALDNRGTLQLRAVSGRQTLPFGDAQVDGLNELLRWLALQPDPLHLRLHEDSPHQIQLPGPVMRHFQATGARGLYSIPLYDDQGRVGLLVYLAADPEFLALPHIEMIKILAGQATVAIRNAMLYREVPLISLLEPLALRKRAWFRSDRTRRMVYLAAAGFVVLLLAVCPLPLRVQGHAVIAPQHLISVNAPAEGNVAAVYAHEGQRVAAGQALGALTDWQWRADLASAEARYRSAQLVMQDDLSRGLPQAGADRTQLEVLRAEAERARARMDDAQLRSPIAGFVATPNLQNMAGQHLDAGAAFAQVLDLTSATVHIQVAQSDVALIAPGQSAAIKLDSYPERSWHGSVAVVSPQADVVEGNRVFNALVDLPNGEASLRAGMSGSAKIFIGYKPAGVVLFRKPVLWLWHTLWNWIGW